MKKSFFTGMLLSLLPFMTQCGNGAKGDISKINDTQIVGPNGSVFLISYQSDNDSDLVNSKGRFVVQKCHDYDLLVSSDGEYGKSQMDSIKRKCGSESYVFGEKRFSYFLNDYLFELPLDSLPDTAMKTDLTYARRNKEIAGLEKEIADYQNMLVNAKNEKSSIEKFAQVHGEANADMERFKILDANIKSLEASKSDIDQKISLVSQVKKSTSAVKDAINSWIKSEKLFGESRIRTIRYSDLEKRWLYLSLYEAIENLPDESLIQGN